MKNFYLLIITITLGACATVSKAPVESDTVATKTTIKEVDLAYKEQFPKKKRKKKILIFTKPSPQSFSNANLAFHSTDTKLKEILKSDFEEIYTRRGYESIWVNARGPKPTYLDLRELWRQSKYHGLDAEIYNFSSIENRVEKLNEGDLNFDEIAQLDYDITANFLLYSAHLAYGRINPDKLTGYWHKDKERVDLAKKLAKVRNSSNFSKYIDTILPSLDIYGELVESMKKYTKLREAGGWDQIPSLGVDVLEPGERNESIPYVRRRLAVTDLNVPADINDSLLYNDRLVSAVKKFQHRHGLEVDGRLGSNTIKAMNIPIEDKISTLKLNLERTRWLPKEFGDNYFIVNIPEYKLRVYEKNKMAMKMNVIVGKEYTSTPIFSDTIRYLVFSPTWTIPYSIKSKEMLPRLQRNPSHYSGRGYKFYSNYSSSEVNPSNVDWSQYSESNFPFSVVQQPGPRNALGLVKFIMPNSMSIYLHDTPTDYLFERTERALSHGCIRLEKPAELAEYVLRDKKGWDSEKVYDYMHKDSPRRINLDEGIHVQITYLTSFVDELGLINFREDIYHHDKMQMNEIESKMEDIATL